MLVLTVCLVDAGSSLSASSESFLCHYTKEACLARKDLGTNVGEGPSEAHVRVWDQEQALSRRLVHRLVSLQSSLSIGLLAA